MGFSGLSRDARIEFRQRDTKVGVLASGRVLAGYLSMIYEQGQKQGPLTDEEADEAYNKGIERVRKLSKELYKLED